MLLPRFQARGLRINIPPQYIPGSASHTTQMEVDELPTLRSTRKPPMPPQSSLAEPTFHFVVAPTREKWLFFFFSSKELESRTKRDNKKMGWAFLCFSNLAAAAISVRNDGSLLAASCAKTFHPFGGGAFSCLPRLPYYPRTYTRRLKTPAAQGDRCHCLRCDECQGTPRGT